MIDSFFNLVVMTLACPETRFMIQSWLEQEAIEQMVEQELEDVA
jgi:hypothetical protein